MREENMINNKENSTCRGNLPEAELPGISLERRQTILAKSKKTELQELHMYLEWLP